VGNTATGSQPVPKTTTYTLVPALRSKLPLDKAIRAWGEKTEDPYENGLAALYEKRYPEASLQFQKSLTKSEAELATAQHAVSDAAFYLGKSLYGEGRYRESAAAYERSAQLRTDDSIVLNNWAGSLMRAGNYAGAEPLYRRALAIDEKALGPDHPDTGALLNNLAMLLDSKGDYAGAEPLYRRALAIAEKALGPDHPDTSAALNNLATLLRSKGDYAGAEPLYRRALAIREKALGPDHPGTATSLNNLAELLRSKGDYAGAEPLYRRALAIDEKALGPDHPTTRTIRMNLAVVLEKLGK
jgi:tetratricopeptide (TPR) repeat protein